jgi:hypothetical protein
MTDNNIKTKEEINKMLDCLLTRDSDCKKCKNCESVDACCFLMEAVVVHKHIEKSKSKC